MDLHLQRPNGRACGQYSVAMLAGITPTQSLQLFGRAGATQTWEIREALRRLGYEVAPRMKGFAEERDLPTTCLLKQSWPGRSGWHWCVYHHGMIYCPDKGIYAYSALPSPDSRFTSYLSLTKP